MDDMLTPALLIVDASASSTSKVLGEGTFSIRYVTPGSGVVGNYISDDFSMGGMKIKQLTMAVATDAKFVPTGIMGIGFAVGESMVQSKGVAPYPNIIDELVSQKLTNTRAYSLWLNDLGTFPLPLPHRQKAKKKKTNPPPFSPQAPPAAPSFSAATTPPNTPATSSPCKSNPTPNPVTSPP